MALPQGFNPQNMTFGNMVNSKPVIDIPTNNNFNPPPFRGRYRESLWKRFNRGIAGIGNWFAKTSGNMFGWIKFIVYWSMIIGGGILVVTSLFTDGWVTALGIGLVIAFIGVVFYYILSLLITFVINVVLYVFRLIFWNGWTFLFAVGLTVFIIAKSNEVTVNDTVGEMESEWISDYDFEE